jgi:hypothetical protein
VTDLKEASGRRTEAAYGGRPAFDDARAAECGGCDRARTQRDAAGTGVDRHDRGAAGVGLGLLLANRLSAEERKALGWGLFLLGAMTTIPLALEVLGKRRPAAAAGRREEPELAGYRG